MITTRDISINRKYLEKSGWRLEHTFGPFQVYLLNDIVFAKDKREQIDIFYELKLDIESQYMMLIKYSNSAEGVVLFEGSANVKSFKSAMEYLDL